jgi:hypothetical protein
VAIHQAIDRVRIPLLSAVEQVQRFVLVRPHRLRLACRDCAAKRVTLAAVARVSCGGRMSA